MKKILSVSIVVALFAMALNAQWKFDKAFPDTATSKKYGGIHGMVVDPEGKVWVQDYYVSKVDSLLVGGTTPVYKKIRIIDVFKPDGTPASFSPLKILTFPDNSKDTLSGYVDATGAWTECTGRGLGLDKDGNILATFYDRVYKIDYKTGAGLLKIYTAAGASLTRATSAPSTGDIFVANVAPGNPIRRYSNTGTQLSNVADTSIGYSRGFEVTYDGNTVFWAGYDKNYIRRYQRANALSPYKFKDTILIGMTAESQMRDPKTTTNIWVCAGPADAAPAAPYTMHTWYAVDVNTLALKDSVTMQGDTSSTWAAAKHRAIGFTKNGDTCYTSAWLPGAVPGIQRYIKKTNAVTPENNLTVASYALSQNFPNPFNPTTKISFDMPKSGFVTLKVYDVLGREVATLVNEFRNAGSHNVGFDASKLSSGTYIYRLSVNGFISTQKMALVK